MNAFYLVDPPVNYDAFERLVKTYRDTGAGTLIIKPVSRDGSLDRKMLAKAVFFAHSSGLKIFVLLPTRGMQYLFSEHPEWQDAQYSVLTGGLEPIDRLDLFNPHVMVSLTDLFRDIAGYSVDGIILDDDYYYSDTEGMSAYAFARYKQSMGTSFPIGKSLGRIDGVLPHEHAVNGYGEAFWKLAEMKKAKLLLLLRNIMQASRAVNKEVSFGIALHVPGLFVKEKELLAWYSHDLSAFRKMGVDYFWLAIPHREMRARKEINYGKSIETVARLTVSSLSLVNDPAIMVIAVQTVTTEGKPLSLTEVEEISTQVRRSGDSGIAFMVSPDSQLPPELTKKIFKNRKQ
jgi:hypothetical protein